MENESVFTFDKIIKCSDLGYAGDSDSKWTESFGLDLKQRVDKFLIPSLPVPAVEKEESNGLQGEGVEMFIPKNSIDIVTQLIVLLGLKLSGHTNTITKSK